jgi:uncharacterized protein HemY
MELYATASEMRCPAVSPEGVIGLAQALRDSPKYAGHRRYNMVHYLLLSSMQQRLGDETAAITSLRKAYDFQPNADVVILLTGTLARSGDIAGAREFLDRAASEEPANPMKAIRWRRVMDSLYDHVDALEAEKAEQR